MSTNEQAPRVSPNQVEVRGYEVAKLLRDGSWGEVIKYRPTKMGLGQAAADVTYLSRNHPKEQYQLRAICSVELPTLPTRETLHLEADETDGSGPSATAESEDVAQADETLHGIDLTTNPDAGEWKLPEGAPLPHVIRDEDLPAAIEAHQQEANAQPK